MLQYSASIEFLKIGKIALCCCDDGAEVYEKLQISGEKCKEDNVELE